MCTIDESSKAGSDRAQREPSLRVTVHEAVRGSERTLALAGELDLGSRPLLDEALQRVELEQAAVLVLDLREVTFMDSTGLHAVLAARELCAERGCRFQLVRGSAQVQRVFELSGVLDELPFRAPAAAA
jgi:anti-sigma B factor antagonist